MNAFLNQLKQYPKNWPYYQISKYKVDLQQIESQYSSVPNDLTKEYLERKTRFLNRMIEGYQYLSAWR